MARKKQPGSTLIEALVALAILTTVIMVALSVMSATSRSARVTRNKIQCLGYAQDAIEKIRNIRDTNIKNGLAFDNNMDFTTGQVKMIDDTTPGTKNSFKTQQVAPGTNEIPDTNFPNFKRQITITENSNIMTVKSEVTYFAGLKCSASEQLTDWRKS